MFKVHKSRWVRQIVLCMVLACVSSSSGVPFERGEVYQVIGWFVAV
ncbi:hypothetical protein [Bifidobacterium pullorum]|nr:hypothetical protein [Bifidobacterium pullorum]